MTQKVSMGLDVGSTTVKIVVLNHERKVVYSTYRRHFSDVHSTVRGILLEVYDLLGSVSGTIHAAGSGGLGIAKVLEIPFSQEVIACTKAVEEFIPHTDVAIELGGEDAKITYFGAAMDQRMNGTCAGGTGAFIDQMATLLKTDAQGLNDLAARHTTIYPIAARCGVFAKTDIQPLINEGARSEDIAASVFQAVVNQTISGLACGRPIRGHVAFLGGPLHFLPQLRQRFIETLGLKDEEILVPTNANLFVAMGAALLSLADEAQPFETIIERLQRKKEIPLHEVARLAPLFETPGDYEAFKARHDAERVPRRPLQEAKGPLYLGIDAGSTTSKVALVDEADHLVYSFYGSNEGKPLDKVVEEVRKVYAALPEGTYLAHACVTGYGESLIKEALNVDLGEIETIAHYKASNHFLEGVDFILDIGGQDMKCLRIKNGVIDSILLNEACSSGCGSFIETFAKGLNHTPEAFSKEALTSQGPVDLGTRCTVFMNSRVKQAQKEGASVGDISAGLSYSVIKNALYKVIKIRNPKEMGERIIVQGGTFYNDAVLRAFELVSGVQAVRPDIAGLMGAYGAALIARERSKVGQRSSLRSPDEMKNFTYETKLRRCGLCANNCQLTINRFPGDKQFISGNRCDRPLGNVEKSSIPNGFAYKFERTFKAYHSLPANEAPQGVIGIPRVLNLYENYPFWHTVLTQVGFSVLLSPQSSKQVYEMGMETIPSESVCYPGKLVHGHIEWLIRKHPQYIFYPCIPYEEQEFASDNHYNCPIVTSYPEVIKNNVDHLRNSGTKFLNPFLNIGDRKGLAKRLHQIFKPYTNITLAQWREAVEAGFLERDAYKEDIRRFGEETLEYMKDHDMKGVVLAGRPYHVDPEIHHGIPEVITSFGMAVLTEDSICHRDPDPDARLRVVDQWTYHSRLYHAARMVSSRDDLEMIQLNSFGCGLDAVTTDQVQEILGAKGKIYTCLKIDEGNNLGAARIRIRSLKAAMAERERNHYEFQEVPLDYAPIPFTKEMKKTHTILAPQMSPIHLQFVEAALGYSGFNVVLLPEVDKGAVEAGLKYVNNDACYPSILVTGQLINALQSGTYDLDHTTVLITQTGGGCRATNYVAFIRKALKDAGFGNIPCVPLSVQGFENHPGMQMGMPTISRAGQGIIYGDLLMRVLYRVRPYEKVKGSANALYKRWAARCIASLEKGSFRDYEKNCRAIVRDFDELPIFEDLVKPKVGLVGEILVKFHPTANNSVVDVLESEGAEALMPDLTDFFLYSALDTDFKHKFLGASKKDAITGHISIYGIEFFRKAMKKALKQSQRFSPPPSIYDLARKTEPVLQLGNMTGEGWFLTGEMLELLEEGVNNIICMQPFACLPNHVTGKGVIKRLRELHPEANIAAIDYDPGASEVNQLNRIKLMLSVAFKNLKGRALYSFAELNETMHPAPVNPLTLDAAHTLYNSGD
ncbi:Activator of (R)-2-hydroxyglutaryl-CoA dehydratase [Clostridiaceae bacterium JG1575]|nr:Activator of (R)-2-hydroxyglutaryl-CoA dehydratase [Clostridiaceae bacterium JG1575]